MDLGGFLLMRQELVLLAVILLLQVEEVGVFVGCHLPNQLADLTVKA